MEHRNTTSQQPLKQSFSGLPNISDKNYVFRSQKKVPIFMSTSVHHTYLPPAHDPAFVMGEMFETSRSNNLTIYCIALGEIINAIRMDIFHRLIYV